MTHFFVIFLLVFSQPLAAGLKINLICPANGKGLEIDGNILETALTSFGCHVNWIQKNERSAMADINLFCEKLEPQLFQHAHLNWFIPNPEYFCDSLSDLKPIDLILCRTKEVERIFKELGHETFFLGFTTFDAHRVCEDKNFNAFLHVAGGSPFKGTKSVSDVWKNNPSLPLLTVITTLGNLANCPSNILWHCKRFSREKLRILQNQSGVHLCLSETEGFGHYLMEAMSCGSVVITVDAPPMNEFIQDPRFLVPYNSTAIQSLGIRYFVATEVIEAKIYEILSMSPAELKAAGDENRLKYMKNDKQFRQNLKSLIDAKKSHLR